MEDNQAPVTQQEINSLSNLSAPKERRMGYGQFYKPPIDIIDKLFSLMAAGKKITAAAKEAGISFPTAKKYYELGDPKRGIVPIKQRLGILNEHQSTKNDAVFIEVRNSHIRRVERIIDAMNAQIFGDNEDSCDTSGETKKAKASLNLPEFSYRDYEKMLKLHLDLLAVAKDVEPSAPQPDQDDEPIALTPDQIMNGA